MVVKLELDKDKLLSLLHDEAVEDAAVEAAPGRLVGVWEMINDPVIDDIKDGKVYLSVEIVPEEFFKDDVSDSDWDDDDDDDFEDEDEDEEEED